MASAFPWLWDCSPGDASHLHKTKKKKKSECKFLVWPQKALHDSGAQLPIPHYFSPGLPIPLALELYKGHPTPCSRKALFPCLYRVISSETPLNDDTPEKTGFSPPYLFVSVALAIRSAPALFFVYLPVSVLFSLLGWQPSDGWGWSS